jgi:hypothetical protein
MATVAPVVYEFRPAGFDAIDPRYTHPAAGTRVIKTQPVGCPPNGTMGHCFIADAESGKFYGLVSLRSLVLV